MESKWIVVALIALPIAALFFGLLWVDLEAMKRDDRIKEKDNRIK